MAFGDDINNCIFSKPSEQLDMYRNIIEESVSGVAVMERESRHVIFMNKFLRKIYGIGTTEDVSGKHLAELIPDENAVLSREDISGLSYDHYEEYHKLFKNMYIGIHAKAIVWNGIESYIMYLVDETSEYKKNFRQKEIINRVPAGIGVYRIDHGNVEQLYMNDAYYTLVSQDRASRCADTYGDVLKYVNKRDVPAVDAFVKRLINGDNISYVDHRLLCGNKKYRWFRLNGSVLEREGDVLTVYCVYTDVEETKRAQEKLEKADEALQIEYDREQQKRQYLERDAIATFALNITLGAIGEYRRVSGLKGGVIHEGMGIKDYVRLTLSHIPIMKDRENFSLYFNREKNIEDFKNGEREQNIEFRYRHDDGTLHWFCADSIMRSESSTGDIVAYISIRDIDRRKKQILAYDSVIDNDTDYVTVLNAVTGMAKLIRIKGEYGGRALGTYEEFEFNSFCNDVCKKEVVPEDAEKVMAFYNTAGLAEMLADGRTESVLFRHIYSDGTVRRKKTQAFYLDEVHEDILIICRDVTDVYDAEQKQRQIIQDALQKAEVASRAKGDFLSSMSHEIRTPMNAIIGMTDLALDTVISPETKKYLTNIKHSADYLLGILNDMLDMSRIESGKFVLTPKWVSQKEVLNTCSEIIRPMAEKKHISYTCINREPGSDCYVDALKVERMIMNILNNACKFTPENGHIELIAQNIKRGGGSATDCITISDDGCGMSKEFLGRVFTPFSQERNVFSDTVNGTGLGLALARQIARAMDGDITVESTLGKGSKFTITITYEYRKSENKDTRDTKNREDDIKILDKTHILVCEDNNINSQIAQELLMKKGCIVDIASDGQIGVDMFNASEEGFYDAILMDVRMPRMNGLEAASAIRALNRKDAKKVVIVAMSANAFEEDIQKSMEAGMNDHLAKPVEPELMYGVLAKKIKERRSHRTHGHTKNCVNHGEQH